MHLSFYFEDSFHYKTLLNLVQKVVYGGFLLIPKTQRCQNILAFNFFTFSSVMRKNNELF